MPEPSPVGKTPGSSRPRRRRPSRHHVALGLLAVGVWTGAFSLNNLIQTLQVSRWPTAVGRVRAARISTDTVAVTFARYGNRPVRGRRLHLMYDYDLVDRSFQGTRIRLRQGDAPRPSVDSTTYRVGSPVLVHYDPREPASAVLDTRLGASTTVGLIATVLLLTAARWAYRRPDFA